MPADLPQHGSSDACLPPGSGAVEHSDVTQERRLLAELQRSNAELEQFASVLAHDLADPLRVASGYAELLSQRYSDTLDATARGFVEQISAATGRMQRMLDTMGRFARVGGGRLELAPVDSRGLVEATLDVMRGRIEEAGAIVEVGRLPTVQADAVLLEQAFQNLIANGLKFASPERPPVVRVEAERVEADWVFSLSDNGIGLHPEEAERAFSLFGRLHPDQFEGEGLGLAIVKKLIDRHGGRIWVEPVTGEGTCFRFTIPA
jgi:chemotaxis family two-component system sensor kinase Cph1